MNFSQDPLGNITPTSALECWWGRASTEIFWVRDLIRNWERFLAFPQVSCMQSK